MYKNRISELSVIVWVGEQPEKKHGEISSAICPSPSGNNVAAIWWPKGTGHERIAWVFGVLESPKYVRAKPNQMNTHRNDRMDDGVKLSNYLNAEVISIRYNE